MKIEEREAKKEKGSVIKGMIWIKKEIEGKTGGEREREGKIVMRESEGKIGKERERDGNT